MHIGRGRVDDGWLDCCPEGALDGVGINYFNYLASIQSLHRQITLHLALVCWM